MRFLFYIAFGVIIQISAIGYSQDVTMSVHLKNAGIIDVFNEIERQSEYKVFYKTANISRVQTVNIDEESIAVDVLLNRVLDEAELTYEVIDRVIVVTPAVTMAQGVTVTGTITDVEGATLPGVNVLLRGTTTGVVTDAGGNYRITVPDENAVLVFSFVGFTTQEIAVGNQTIVNVMLSESSQQLDEVVVIGYGVLKKKLVTGSTIQIKGDDIQQQNTVNPISALQSKAPGVSIIQSSGMPGEGFKVTIRGLGTTGNSAPLFIIDGFAGGDINNLNPADIESIDILKDAASAAIYGSRAANGVVMITTKQGKSGKVQVSYDGYFGIQTIYKMPPLLNAQEYMMIINEGRANDNTQEYDFASYIPNYYPDIMAGRWDGTNWMEATYNKNAPVQNHAVNITGGTEQNEYSLGISYTNQEGIIGEPVSPKFERYTMRLNTTHHVLKSKSKDFDIIKVGENIAFTFRQNNGIGIGYRGNNITRILRATPLLPLFNDEGGYYNQHDKEINDWNWDSYEINPVGLMQAQNQNLSKNKIFRGNLYLEVQPIKNLIYRTSFGFNTSSNSYRRYLPVYSYSTRDPGFALEDQISQSMNAGHSWMWENTLSYKFSIQEYHSFETLVGQSVEKWGMGESISGSNRGSLFTDFEYGYLSNVTAVSAQKSTLGGSPWDMGRLASFFGRLNYNYDETYLLTLVLRADGSSNFARGKRWGYFPSVSAGWVVSSEGFMESTRSWLDILKIRVNYGQNGNSNISAFQYLSTISFNAGYFFGPNKSVVSTGAYPDILPNRNVTWETSEQIDVGFDSRFLNSRLGLTFDWYSKTTRDWLVQAPILDSYGANAPYINGGDVNNKGIEIGSDWNDRIGDFGYGVNLNVSYNKNKVLRIANSEGIIHGPRDVLFQSSNEMYRAQEEYPIGYFYGYKTLGVFQNETEIANYAGAKLEGRIPGDLIYADTNGDGLIDEEDRCEIGNPHPDYLLGFGLNMNYKGFDLSITATGAFGHQIMKAYRDYADTPNNNYTRDILDRWHGDGTSNRLPRLTGGTNTNWQWISDIYMENGDYLRIQNLTIGYDLKTAFPKMPFTQTRIYVSAQNLLTFTGYSGMDPEIGWGDGRGWASGIDVGFYPSPRTFLFGVNLKF